MQHHGGMNARVLAASVLVASLASPAFAGPPTDTLRQGVDRVLRIVEKPGDHPAEIRKVAQELFDFEQTARRSLGPHWNARTPEERREFVDLFAELLERTYVRRIESGAGGTVTYVGESIDGDEATVRTRVLTQEKSDIPIDYRMRRKNGRWVIYDVSIEGVSLIANYRTQFNRVIQTESYDALVARLRSKEPEPAASPVPRPSRRD
jgi:phospholipid transport system substrate-binding protein